MDTAPPFLLIDGSSFVFRAYYALPPLTNAAGCPTGAVFGAAQMLKKLLEEQKPTFVAVVFDTSTPNFRHRLYPAYKAHRREMPEDLAVQLPLLYTLIAALGIPIVKVEGVEADDVIATLASKAADAEQSVLIVTGDKDLAQLVNGKIQLLNTTTTQTLGEREVVIKFGVRPDQMVDYLSLVGDPVDNVPGVPMVGPKTAAKWLAQYGDLDAIIEKASEISGKVGENLRASLDQLPLARQLVSVDRNIPLSITWEQLVEKPKDLPALKQCLTELEFHSWLREFEPKEKEKKTYETVLEKKVFLAWLKILSEEKQWVIDTETTGLNPLQAELVGLSFSVQEGLAMYVPLAHHYVGCPEQLSREWVLSQLKPLLEDPQIGKIGQNIKYDKHILANYGIVLQGIQEDTMLGSYVLNSTEDHNLDHLAEQYLQYQTITFEDVAGKGAKQICFDAVEIDKATAYAAEDADVTLRLHHMLSDKLKKVPSLEKVYRQLEVPLIDVLWQMEAKGVLLDKEGLYEQSQRLTEQLQYLEKEAFELAGVPFNLNSPKQLQTILYEKLHLPVLEKTPKGAPSTAESVLEALGHHYELPKVVLRHRLLSKLQSTYTDKLPLLVNPKTERIHTSYHQAVTSTGRLSSSDPNLQNIPIRTEEGRKIRQAFIAPPGKVLLSADYSQIELRIMAHLSQDPGLLHAFQSDQDIHQYTAHEIWDLPLDGVTEEARRRAKAINFGLIYGMSAFGLAKQLGVSREEASTYMAQYFKRYPGVQHYMESIRKSAFEKKYVETLFGRRLYLPEIDEKKWSKRQAAERAAINAPMQGTAADIIKQAMIQLHHALRSRKEIAMLMQVHDELVLEVAEDKIDEAKQLVRSCMEEVISLSVPLKVEIGVGPHWDAAH